MIINKIKLDNLEICEKSKSSNIRLEILNCIDLIDKVLRPGEKTVLKLKYIETFQTQRTRKTLEIITDNFV